MAKQGQSLVAIVPHSDVAKLVGQFLSTPGGGKAPRTRSVPANDRRRREDHRRLPRQQDRQQEFQRRVQGRQRQERETPRRQELSQDLIPLLNGHQLIGDSLLSRLGSFISHARPSFNKSLNANQLGLCVSGQTIGQLLRLLKSRHCPKMEKKVILMIGTNNFLKRVPLEDGQRAFKSVVDYLKEKTDKLILVTIPPIPKLMEDDVYKTTWLNFNQFIKSIPNSDNLFVYDCNSLFFKGESVIGELFEKDKVHWTRAGMQLIKKQLKEVILLS